MCSLFLAELGRARQVLLDGDLMPAWPARVRADLVDAPEKWPWSSAHAQAATKGLAPDRDSLPVLMKWHRHGLEGAWHTFGE